MPKTQKETIEYDKKFLTDWNDFCDSKGYVKRRASHACRLAFMTLTPDSREEFMAQVAAQVTASRTKRCK